MIFNLKNNTYLCTKFLPSHIEANVARIQHNSCGISLRANHLGKTWFCLESYIWQHTFNFFSIFYQKNQGI